MTRVDWIGTVCTFLLLLGLAWIANRTHDYTGQIRSAWARRRRRRRTPGRTPDVPPSYPEDD